MVDGGWAVVRACSGGWLHCLSDAIIDELGALPGKMRDFMKVGCVIRCNVSFDVGCGVSSGSQAC
jgi:hypothetical protein